MASFVFKKWNTTVDKIGRQKYPPSCVYPLTCALFPQITDRSEAASSAVDSMEVKHGEPLVVQFAAP